MSKRSDQRAYPLVGFDDPVAMIDWLKDAFGAEVLSVHKGDDGGVAHSELSFEGGIVMGGTKNAGELSSQVEIGSPTSVYLIVSDPDAHHERAKAAGAEIVIPLRDEDYGSRGYSALDPEGNVWSFGTYRPEVP
ncbi:MAG: bleomycin resistance protein [Actinomycetota bacterium]|nr:bleomycin resistance protein [Actinomycetota bacterium]